MCADLQAIITIGNFHDLYICLACIGKSLTVGVFSITVHKLRCQQDREGGVGG
jgi:hypothetical protein